MSSASDSFTRANNLSLGPNWTVVNQSNGQPATNTQILGNGAAPGPGPFTGSGTSFSAYNAVLPQTPDQLVSAQLNSVAPPTSVLSISAVTANSPIAGQATYTYTLSSGAALVQPQQIIITGMQNAANNQNYSLTVSVTSSTFVIANAGAITESGSAGTGLTPCDSLITLAARMSADGLNNYFLFLGNNSAYFGGGTDNRQGCRELWKNLAGVGTDLAFQSLTAPDPVNDIFTLLVTGKKISYFHNSAFVSSADDTTVPGPGYFALGCQSANVSGHATPFTGQTFNAVTGTSVKNWAARDVGTINPSGGWTKQAEDSFNAAPNYAGFWTVQSAFPVQITFTAAGGINGGMSTSGAGNSSAIQTGRSWANDQSSTLIVYSMTGNISLDCLVRAATAVETFYFLQVIATNGSGTTIGAGTWSVQKVIAGTFTILIAATAITINSLDCYRLEVHGTTLTAYINGTQVGQVTDASIASGSPGLLNPGPVLLAYWSGDEFTGLFAIGGNAGAAASGATITYTGTSSGSVTADALGNYSITGLSAGTYTLTPSKTGMKFSPASAAVVVSAANVTQNFTTGGGSGDLGPGFDFKFRL